MKPTRIHTPRRAGRPACGRDGYTTIETSRVNCQHCRRTAWWAAAHEYMPRTLVMWPAKGASVNDLATLTDEPIVDYAEAMPDYRSRQYTERGDVLRWLLTHPEAPIRWRLAAGRVG